MSDHKKVLIKFKKSASAEDRAKIIDDLKSKGAESGNTDNVNSSFFPFVTMSVPEEHFDSLQSQFAGGGHNVVDHIEEDKEMKIQM